MTFLLLQLPGLVVHGTHWLLEQGSLLHGALFPIVSITDLPNLSRTLTLPNFDVFSVSSRDWISFFKTLPGVKGT